ncbi:Na(+) H(+) antiporter subunit G [hydrothermal vent metagenome]|uniref:Na(+) H(+) antiporter subunit G n=1 Tax=hydrothermal vent metagenome TaxID=652676 RepID=A0A1W1CPI7_9ZZZZ
MLDTIGFFIIFLGILLLIISAIGLLRMPDTITRMHAGTKASTLGSLLVILGTMFLEPSLWFKLAFLAIFILITNPLSSSILARSTYLKHGFFNKSGIDDLKDKK